MSDSAATRATGPVPAPGPARVPPPLAAGARIALVAPAGPLAGEHELERAIDNTRQLGFEPVVGAHALSRRGYFAGDDAARRDDLLAAITDDTVDAIWCLRGGYGAMRLLRDVAPAIHTARPRTLLGFSDVTALHAAWEQSGIVSLHGPTARATLTPFSRDALTRALAGDVPLGGTWERATCLRPGRATGRLAGGNLALLAALCGTPWHPSFAGAIVVLEDVTEPSYRLDRLLVQLRLAGAFDGCVGIAAGHCTDCPDTSGDESRGFGVLLHELAADLDVPAVVGLPIGHIADQWTLPLGATALLDAGDRRLDVPPYRSPAPRPDAS